MSAWHRGVDVQAIRRSDRGFPPRDRNLPEFFPRALRPGRDRGLPGSLRGGDSVVKTVDAPRAAIWFWLARAKRLPSALRPQTGESGIRAAGDEGRALRWLSLAAIGARGKCGWKFGSDPAGAHPRRRGIAR